MDLAFQCAWDEAFHLRYRVADEEKAVSHHLDGNDSDVSRRLASAQISHDQKMTTQVEMTYERELERVEDVSVNFLEYDHELCLEECLVDYEVDLRWVEA